MTDPSAVAMLDALLADDAEKHYHQAPCGYVSTTEHGLILRVNETFLTMTGYRSEELIGIRRFSDLLTPGGRIYHETHVGPMLHMQGKVNEIALELACADGRRLPVLVNWVLGRDVEGRPSVIRIAIFEATVRREYERELLHAKKRAEESEARATALAHTLQKSLIPPALPQIAGLDIAAVYRPAGDGEEVGGDFYDVFEIGPNDWVVVIGDVMGKGVDAAVVTALARHTLRAAAVRVSNPSRALETLNQVLLQHDSDRFCTASFLSLRRGDGGWAVTTSSGGHPLPLLMRREVAPTPFGSPGSLLGILDAPLLTDTTTTIGSGDAIVLYTDGVTEGRRDGVEFGGERLKSCLSRHVGSATALSDGILGDALDFQSGAPRDDIAIIAIVVP